MRVVPIEGIQSASRLRAGFRKGNIVFRDLLVGEEGTPNNYGLQLVEVPDSYSTPRHRHNFEQIRFMLEGSFGFGSGVQDEGSVGFFCEGTHYAQAAEGKSTMLLLQIGGPTGQGFMSRRQVRAGTDSVASAKGGVFEGGIFTWYDDAGKKHNQDSYEAVWEHVHGKRIVYPKPQYEAPIVFRPERFPWHAVVGESGVDERRYGVFNDRGLAMSGLRLKTGSRHVIAGEDRERLLFCLEGSGRIDGSSEFSRWTSVGVARGEGTILEAATDSEFLMISIPDYSQD